MLPALSDPFWPALLAKMLASALVVVTASMIVERVGPFLGAMVATLPISAGPSFAFLALEHGAAFLEASVKASFPAFAATAVFAAVYVRLAQSRGVLLSTGAALVAWSAAAVAIRGQEWTVAGGAILNAVVFGGAILASRPYRRAIRTAGAVRTLWDIPFRAAVVMSLVAAVVIAGRVLGPEAAGVTAVLPVVFMSVALVLQPRLGGTVPAAMMANGLVGLIGFIAALAVLSVSAVALGSVAALLLALAICVGWNVMLVGVRQVAATR